MTIIGIDPGMSGGIAFYTDTYRAPKVFDIPTFNLAGKGKTRRQIDAVALNALFGECGDVIIHAYIEKAQSMPGQGVASTFAYGRAYGTIIGLLVGRRIAYTEVHPKTWKKVILADMNKESKDASRLRAQQLWPDCQLFGRKKDQHVAEAALIAEYGRRILLG